MLKLTNPRETQDRLNLNTKGGTRKQDTGETNQANKQGDDWEQVRAHNRKQVRRHNGKQRNMCMRHNKSVILSFGNQRPPMCQIVAMTATICDRGTFFTNTHTHTVVVGL